MENSLKERIEKIDKEIYEFAGNWVYDTLKNFTIPPDPGPIYRILDPGIDLIKRGGKRWRPLLMLLCCESLGGGEQALPFAPVIEIIHNGTLIADDIEDNSDMRRGDKAVHLKYGVDMALNTGNFMCFLPSLVIDRARIPEEQKGHLYRFIFEDLRNLHIGQGLDIQWHRKGNPYIPSLDEYFLMCRLKTGTLARLAAKFGIVLGEGQPELAEKVGKVCENFGVGFQVVDDIKNLTTGNPGKQVGDDIIEGKKSLPLILAMKNNTSLKKELLALLEFCSGASPYPGEKVKDAIALIEETGAINKAREIAGELIRNAGTSLRELLPDNEARNLIFSLFEELG